MPPKAARGAARGRGRGRGRGGKASATDTSSAPRPELGDDIDTLMGDSGPATSTTPLHEQEQNDPNSPATQPTETPAPTPVRIPPTTSNTSRAAAGAASGAGQNAPPKASRFKPKMARTDAKEREEREAREREKENARLGIAAAAAARAARMLGRGRGGRGRGDAMGRGRGQTSSTASGPFAEAPESRKGFFSGGGGGAVKREAGIGQSRGTGSGPSGSSVKTEGGGYSHNGFGGGSYDAVNGRFMPDPQYPDEDESAPRVDIEHINIQSDSEEDVVITGVRSLNKGKGKMSNKGGLKPVRLGRKEHKERVTMVNTDPAVKSAPEGDESDVMLVDEGASSKALPPKRIWQGTYGDDDDEVKIKAEPGTVPETSFTQEPTASSPPPSEFKAPGEIGDENSDTEQLKAEPVSPRLERKAKPRRLSEKKIKVPVMQTEEDRAEWSRHLEDVEILRKELQGLTAQPRDKSGIDVNMEGGATAAAEEPQQEKEDGRVYLFQFPPVVPKLYNDKTSANPNMASYDGDLEMTVPFDLTRDEKTEIKSEEKVIEIKQEELDDEELRRRTERESLVVEEGAIGKLILRKSGEVELVWGGTNMKVGHGIETNFFSLAAVVDGMHHWQRDDKGKDVPAPSGSRGKSMAMGELMGKFVVSPDWRNIH